MKNNIDFIDAGSRMIQGILTDVFFEPIDEIEEVNEETKIDFITLIIDDKPVFIHPMRELFVVKDIPPTLTFFNHNPNTEAGKKPNPLAIRMMIRKYGGHLFAFDYDLLNAQVGRLKNE